MSQVTVQILMDDQLKNAFDHLCEELGVDISTAINIFAKTMVRQNCFPFDVSTEISNTETREALEEVKRMKQNPNLGVTYTDVDLMIKELLA